MDIKSMSIGCTKNQTGLSRRQGWSATEPNGHDINRYICCSWLMKKLFQQN